MTAIEMIDERLQTIQAILGGFETGEAEFLESLKSQLEAEEEDKLNEAMYGSAYL